MIARTRTAALVVSILVALSALPSNAGTLGESWFEYARIAMSGQEVNANFGGAVAISGGWAVIGARGDDNGPQDVGRVEFWQAVSGQGTWQRRAIVYPPGATSTDLLGENVDIDGDFAVATAKGLDWLGAQFVGAAIVLQRSGTSWNLDGQLIDPDGTGEFMGYGDDVAISGNTIAVGYRSATAGGLQRGKVDLFVRGASTWAPVQTINGTVDNLRIPDGLDLQGDTLVIGADTANGLVGEVYVYERAGGTFSLSQTLGPQGPTVGAFGLQVALNGDRMAVLAIDAIEIFERVGGAWQPFQAIAVPDLEVGSGNPGDVLAFSGDRIHVTLQSTNDVLSYRFDGSQYQLETSLATPTEVFSIASDAGIRLMVGHPTENQNRGVVDVYQYAQNTATSINVSPSPSPAGTSTTISVSVSADTFTPTGRVFIETTGGGFLCTIAPLLGGAGSCSSSVGIPGDYEIVARYDGDLGFVDSQSAPFSHTVLPTPTTTTITSDAPDPSPGGAPVVVQYAVSTPGRGALPAGDPPATPTGNVTVSDGVDSCVGSVAQGQCTITLTTPGNRSLVASYEGDAQFAASQSDPEPHTVVIAADLALDKRQCSSLTHPDAVHRFLLRIVNEGPSTAEAVSVTDELPDGMLFAQASPGCTESAGIVTCALGDLVAGEAVERVIEVQVSVDPPASMINSASVSSLIADPSLGNNSDVTVTLRVDTLLTADGFEFCGQAP